MGIILIGGMPDRHREPDRNEEIMVMGAGNYGADIKDHGTAGSTWHKGRPIASRPGRIFLANIITSFDRWPVDHYRLRPWRHGRHGQGWLSADRPY